MSIKKIATYVMLIFFVCGCRVGPNYPPAEAPMASDWKYSHIEGEGPFVDNWWEVFNDEELNKLEEKAVVNNRNLIIALARVYQARATAGIVCADLYPQLTLDPSYSYQYILEKLFAPPNSSIITSKDNLINEAQFTYALPLNLSYEVDLWGRLRSLCESAHYQAQAQENAFQTTLLMLTTDLANTYFQLRTMDAQVDLYRNTIKAYQKALDINQARYEGKIVNYSDVSRAALELTNVEADYNEAIRQRAVYENALAVLIGIPASDFSIEEQALSGKPPSIPAGMPSEILLKRPDIREAERERASDHASVRAAYAAFFPSLELTGVLGFSSPDLKHFLSWKSRWIGAGVDMSQTIFDGWRKCSNWQYALAVFKESDENYQQIVLTALQEVEDSLVNLERYTKELDFLEQSVKSATKTYVISNDRYLQGVTFYLDVVIAEQQLLQARRSANLIQGQLFAATIQLIKALGGSWCSR